MTEDAPRRSWLRALVFPLYLLLVTEFVLQAAYYFSVGQFLFERVALDWYRPVEVGNFRVKPDLDRVYATPEYRTHVRTNSEGFRVPAEGLEYERPKPEDVYRILLLGPSFAFAAEVDYEFSVGAQVERMLGAAGREDGRRVELINAGVPAWPPFHQFAWFENEGVDYQPDLVIQFAYGSLAVGAEPPLRQVTAEGYLVDQQATPMHRLRATLKKSGIVYYTWLAATRVSALRERRAQEASEGGRGGKIEGAGRELALYGAFDPSDPETAHSIRFYERFREVATAAGARVLFVHFPLSYCIHREDMARWRHLGVEDVDGQMAFNDDFCRHLGAAGIECHNTTEDLIRAAEADSERLYYPIDIHFTERGNRELARSIVRYLRRPDPSASRAHGTPSAVATHP